MTTRELIKALQDADPTGDVPVVVDNKEVYFAECMSAYWDGVAQLHVVDESKKPYWHIVKMRVTTEGWKVRLNVVGVEEFIESIPDGEVIIDLHWSDLGQRAERVKGWESRIAKWRKQIKKIKRDIARQQPKAETIEKPQSADAVDPQVSSTGNPSTREK